ncbi:MAG: peptidase M15 [Planctomycetota bacterium]|nr:MAG: peptidase M15 [Planctomycetota bacterium]
MRPRRGPGRWVLCALLLVALGPRPALAAGADTGSALEAAAAELRARLDGLLRPEVVGEGQLGVQVLDLGSGQVLYAREAGRPLVLASNTKLFTTAAALGLLGAGYRFETWLVRRGTLAGTVLLGDLVLVGGGDPCLGARLDGEPEGALRRLARSVREAGITEVRGDLVADARRFDRQLQHPDWPADQLDRWYAAPVAALNLNDGCVDVEVAPGPAPGAPARVRLSPACALFELDNRCLTVGADDKHLIAVGRRPGTHTIVVRGTVRVGAAPLVTSVALHEPALVVVEVLRRCLAEEGVEVTGRTRLAEPDEPPPGRAGEQQLQPLAVHVSLLAQALPVINKRSQNCWAEMVFKALGAQGGEPGSFARGAAAVRGFALGLGVEPAELEIADGSGLARTNRASPRAVATLLRAMALGPHANPFIASLPIGGEDGTLARRFSGMPGAARVRAKTGTIEGVSALSGYILPARPGGRTLVFSILTNGLPGGAGAARQLQDRMVGAMLAVP